MRWGVKKAQGQGGEEEMSGERKKKKGKGRSMGFSFSPLSWLARLAGKHGAAAKDGRGQVVSSKNCGGGGGGGGVPAFPPCLPKRSSLSPAVIAPGRSPAPAAAEAVPRRLSVGNDSADPGAGARRRYCVLRRHCSLGGDRDDLQQLGRLIPFSLASSSARPPPTAAPSETDAGAARLRRRQHRRRHPRRSLGGGRRSFSGRMQLPLPARVRVRSPRRAAPADQLERFAVVRRTRDPQRAFRESMVEMIAASGGGDGAAARPEELERLLACYLSLNADEHHDCIVKVFRQVWFEHINLQLQR